MSCNSCLLLVIHSRCSGFKIFPLFSNTIQGEFKGSKISSLAVTGFRYDLYTSIKNGVISRVIKNIRIIYIIYLIS